MRGWVAVAIAAGAGSALVLRQAAPLADPISCPGVIELLAVIASRTWRDVPLGSILAAGNAVMLVLALLLLARAIHTIAASIVITIAITLAAAASAAFAPALTPSPAAAFVTTIAAWAAILRPGREEHSEARPVVVLGLLALLAATVTPFMIPAAILAGWVASKANVGRGFSRAKALAPVLVLAPSVVVQVALQGPPSSAWAHLQSCVIPDGGFTTLMDAARSFGSVIAANPVVTALALLGLVSLKRLPRDMTRSLLPLTLVALWGVVIMPAQSASTIAPFVIAFWILAATGLAEVWSAVNRTAGGRVGAVALSISLVVLQLVSTNAHRDASPARDGHDRLSLAMMSALVGALPRGAGLVEEDATTSLLTRALPSRVRASDRFHRVALQASAVTEALGSTRVFALPRSQRVLQYAGFEMIEAVPGAPGLAEIRQAHPCTTDFGSAPVTLAPIVGQRQLGLVADDERSRDHVVIILTGDVPVSAAPAGSTGNFQGRMFDLTVPADHSDFAEEIRKYQLSEWSSPSARYATRIETWRTPGGPLVLPITLGAPAGAGTARLLGTASNQHLRLCPSIPYEVQPLVRRP